MGETYDDIVTMAQSTDPALRALAMLYAGRGRYHAALALCLDHLKDDDRNVRAASAWALDRIGSPEAILELVAALYDVSFDVRSNAGWALVHMARRFTARLVVPHVIDVLIDASSSEDTREMAYLVLNHIGGKAARDAINRYWH